MLQRSTFAFRKKLPNGSVISRLLSGAAWAFVGTFVSKAIALSASVVLAREIGGKQFGEFGILVTSVNTLGVLAGLGLGVSATKLIAERNTGTGSNAGTVAAFSILLGGLTGFLIAGVGFVLAPFLSEYLLSASHLTPHLRIACIGVLFTTLNGVQIASLAGLEAFRSIAKVNSFAALINAALVVLFSSIWGLLGAVVAVVLGQFVSVIITYRLLAASFSTRGLGLDFCNAMTVWRPVARYSTPTIFSSIMAAPVFWFCKSCLASTPGGYVELGIYTAAESWRMIGLMLCQMLSQVSLPVLSQLHASKEGRGFKKVLVFQGGLSTLSASFGVAFVWLIGGLITQAYGDGFEKLGPILVVVVMSTVPLQVTNLVSSFNRSTGRVWWNFALNLIWASAYIPLTFAFVSDGAWGFAVATLLAYFVQMAAALAYGCSVWLLSAPQSIGSREIER